VTLEIKKPELAALIEELKKSGANLDEVLFDTLTARKPTTPEAPVKHRRPPGKKSLAQLFAESPFRGLDLDFERSHDTLRPVDL
jgi:hypothetical protein